MCGARWAYQNNSPFEILVPKINIPTFGSKIAGWKPILAALPVPLIGWMKASLGGSSKGPIFAKERLALACAGYRRGAGLWQDKGVRE